MSHSIEDPLQLAAEVAQRAQTSQYLTTAELAELLRTPAETVRYWRHVGRGPKSFRFPGARRVLYAREDVEAFIADARAGAA
jgi:excisionase family DNA binding protein